MVYLIHLQFKNVCLAIDAGKINGNPILDVTIVHVFSPSKPLLFRALKEFNGTTDDYIAKIRGVIDELREMQITVSSIVGDNVPSQKQAFNDSPNSMQRRYPESIYSIPIWFSCICHTISLMLDEVFDSIDFLNELKTSTKLIITKIFRSKPMVSTMGIVCSSFCKTRWTNEYDIYKWIIKHYDKIEETLMNPPPLIHPYLQKIPNFPIMFYNYIPRHITILTPVRDLITYLEGDKTPACFTYPAIEDCKGRLCEIALDDDPQLSFVAEIIIAHLDEMLNAHYSLLMLKVLFFLTPEGRDVARNIVFVNLIDIEDSNHCKPASTHCTTDTRNEINELINKFDPTDAK